MQRIRTSIVRKMVKSAVSFQKKKYHARGGRVENPRWKLKRQLYGRRKAAKKVNEFVVAAPDGLGIDQCPRAAIAVQATRNDVDF